MTAQKGRGVEAWKAPELKEQLVVCRRQRGYELEEEAMNSGEMGRDTPKEKGKREAMGLCKEKGTGDFFMRGGQ